MILSRELSQMWPNTLAFAFTANMHAYRVVKVKSLHLSMKRERMRNLGLLPILRVIQRLRSSHKMKRSSLSLK